MVILFKKVETMAQEKRKDKRIKGNFGILSKIYREIELEGHLSKISDISKSGLSFLTDTPLMNNDILQITFRIPPDFKQRIELFGRVVDTQAADPSADIREYKVRVAFIQIQPRAQDLLQKLTGDEHFA